MAINTAKSPRRKLRFDTIDQALAEAQRLTALDQSGQAVSTGNWTPPGKASPKSPAEPSPLKSSHRSDPTRQQFGAPSL